MPLAAADRTCAMIDYLSCLNAVIIESSCVIVTISSSMQTRLVPKDNYEFSGYYIRAGTRHPYLIITISNIVERLRSWCLDPCLFAAISHKSSTHHLPPSKSLWSPPHDSYRTLAKNMWVYSSGPQSCIVKRKILQQVCEPWKLES